MKPERIKVRGKWVTPAAFDHNPLYSCQVEYRTIGTIQVGVVHSWMAFDPKYGPENQEQIEWHLKHQTPGAELWEVGAPAAPYA